MTTETKTQQQWTPGPWRAQRLIPDGVIIRKEGWEISTPAYDVCANIDYGAPIRSEADARLIAHAPEMHESLRKLTQLIRNLQTLYGQKETAWLIEKPTFQDAERLLSQIGGPSQ